MCEYYFRNDNIGSNFSTLLQLGTTLLNVAMSVLGSGQVNSPSLFASKVGVAEGGLLTSPELTPEQMLHRQQVTAQ